MSNKQTFKIIKSSTVSIYDGEDELYHIIPTGFNDKYFVLDGGPHFSGKLERLGKGEMEARFGLVITEEGNSILNHTETPHP